MNYTKLQSILPNREIWYIEDLEVVWEAMDVNPEILFPHAKFALFDYGTNIKEAIELLNKNNVQWEVHLDEEGFQYIVI
jgi:hypothetical protein